MFQHKYRQTVYNTAQKRMKNDILYQPGGASGSCPAPSPSKSFRFPGITIILSAKRKKRRKADKETHRQTVKQTHLELEKYTNVKQKAKKMSRNLPI